MFAELSYLYMQICAKQVSKVMMYMLEKEIVVLVCKIKKSIPSQIIQCDVTFASAFTLGS
jgi:hypothetical protein